MLEEASAHICEKQIWIPWNDTYIILSKKKKSLAFSTKVTLCAIYVTDITSHKKMFYLFFQKISLLIGGALKT